MTVTIVFGKSGDGYVYNNDASFTNSRNGPGDATVFSTGAYFGRNNNSSAYGFYLGYVGYDYPAIPATDVVTSALCRLYVRALMSPSFAQDVQWRGYTWSGGALGTADFRTPTQLAALRLDGICHILSGANTEYIQTSSDELLAAMRPATSIEHVLCTNYSLSGTAPTRDEAVYVATAMSSGTSLDPQLVYTSVPRSTLFGVLGAQCQLSDGWAYLESNGAAAPTVNLKFRETVSGTVTTIAAIPVAASGSNTFAIPEGYQALALVADPDGNLFVIGRLVGTDQSLAILAFARGAGVTWTVKPMRSTPLPTYGAAINQVVALWHPYGAGSVVAFASHVGSAGDSITHNELQHAIFDPAPLIAGNIALSPIRASGNSLPALGNTVRANGYFNTWHNEVGTGLDVASPEQNGGSTDQAYVFSFDAEQNPGDNSSLSEGWYILNSGSTGFQWTKLQAVTPYGRKDAGGKVRVVPVSSQAAAFIAADADASWGLTVNIRNHTGTDSTSLFSRALADEGILGMPDGPVVAQTPAWDAIYNSIENRLWIYFVDSADVGKVRRTSIDISTMQPTLSSVEVYNDPGAGAIQAIRVQRNAPVGQTTLVAIAINTGGTLSTQYVVDAFNIAPNAPTLTPRANFDASTAQTFAWTHEDPNNDTQYAYQLEVSNVATGVVTLDTGKVLSAVSSRNVAGGTIPNGADYRWRVRTWDPSDVQGPYSGYGTFSTSAGGTVTITVPATNDPLDVITDDIPIQWSAAGTVQAAYRVWLYRGAILVSDTNWIASTATTATVAGMLSDQAHEIRVQLRNAALVVTNIATRTLTPSYSTPEKPVVTIQAQPDEGYVLIAVDNPTPGAPALGIPESGFESGAGTWTPGPNATAVADAVIFHRGAGALRVTSTLTGQDPVYARDYVNPGAVVAGERYTARMWVYCSISANISAVIDWLTAASAYISSSAFGQVVPATTWTLIEVTGTAPATATKAVYGPAISGGVVNGTYVVVDEVTLGTASDRPDVTLNQILRRNAGTEDPFEVVGTTTTDATFKDYTATAGVTYEYRIRGNS